MHIERFLVFIVVSLAAFVLLLRWSMRHRANPASWQQVFLVSLAVVVVGMLFAKLGANFGLSPAIYFGLPALVTIALPPMYFRMTRREGLQYIGLVVTSSPTIHVLFSLAVGWHEYLPFWYVPSLTEIIRSGE